MEVDVGQYTIWSRRSSDWERLDVIEDWQSLKVNKMWDDVSTWELVLPMEEFISAFHLSGTAPQSLISDGSYPLGIIVIRNHTELVYNLLSGPILNLERKWDGYNDVVTLTGESDTYWLRTRICYPDPRHRMNATTHWWANNATKDPWYHTTAKLTTAAYYLAAWNMGVPALDERQLPYFTVQANDQGDTVEYWARMETLFDAVSTIVKMQLSDTTVFGFCIRQISDTASTRLILDIREPTDKSADAVFGVNFGNIREFTYTEHIPEYNHLIVGGGDWDGSAWGSDPATRIYLDVNPTVAVESVNLYGTIEGFESYTLNATDLATSLGAMGDYGLGVAKDAAFNTTTELDLQPETISDFLTAYSVGDIVSVDLGLGHRFTNYLREIDYEITPDGEIVTPIVCDPWKQLYAGGRVGALGRRLERKMKKEDRMS